MKGRRAPLHRPRTEETGDWKTVSVGRVTPYKQPQQEEQADQRLERIWKCAICHAADGSGKTAMGKNLKIKDLHSPDVQKQSDADVKTRIAKGKGKMPAFEGKLTADEIDQIVVYIRELGKQK